MIALTGWLADLGQVVICGLGVVMFVHYVCTLGFMPRRTPLTASIPVVFVIASSAGMVASAVNGKITDALYFTLVAGTFSTAFNIILWAHGYHVSQHFNQNDGLYSFGKWRGSDRRVQSVVREDMKHLDHKRNALEALTGSAGIFLVGFITIPLVASMSGAQVSMMQGAVMGFWFFLGRIVWLFANRTWHAMRLERK